MRFANPEMFLLLLLLPAGWFALRWWRRRRQERTGLATLSFANHPALLAAARKRSLVRWAWLPTGLRALGVALLVVALARPQAEDWETLSGRGLDIMICLDMSGSMNAVDMDFDGIASYQQEGKEPPNRFQVAVDTLKRFIANRRGDRVGLVVFSTEAYLKFPLTLDYQTATDQLDALVLDNMERDQERPGCLNGCTILGERTAVGDALSKAYKRLEKSDAPGRLIVLITDGNDNASKLKPLDVARYIGDQPDAFRPGLYAFLVGGGPQSKMPQMDGPRQLRQYGFLQYVQYDEGVDETAIRDMVDAARGTFHVSYDEDQFRKAFSTLEQSEHEAKRVARRSERFLPVLLAGLSLLALELLLGVTVWRRFP